MDSRIKNEIEFGKFLANNDAEYIWNWNSPAGKLRAKDRVDRIVGSIEGAKNKEVLELGCGTANFTKYFAKEFLRIHSIDISEDLINIAQKNIKDANVTFSVQNAMQTDFEDEKFDAVVGVSVLHHLDVNKALNEIYRVLKTGGIIAFSEPNYLNPHVALERSSKTIRKYMNVTPDETAFIRFSLINNLKSSKFSDITITPFDFLHPITPEPLIPAVKKMSNVLELIPLLKEISGSLFITARK